jgi:hypothetical protein
MRKMSLGKIITATLILAFLAIPFLMFPPTVGTMHHAHLAMNTPDCPYMTDTQALCPINLAFILQMWESIFSSAISNIKLLVFFILCLVVVSYTRPISKSYTRYRQKTKSDISILYRELFSNGILNPKVF